MIADLDSSLEKLLTKYRPDGSQLAKAEISFDLPDGEWRKKLTKLTVNCYLYDVRENTALRQIEPRVVRESDGTTSRVRPPVRVDCAYCITAWSAATPPSISEEHALLGDVLMLLLKYETLPADILAGDVAKQLPPYPMVVASTEGAKTQAEFWHALDQRLKPSLNYVVTLAVQVQDKPATTAPIKTATLSVGQTKAPKSDKHLLTSDAESVKLPDPV